MKTVTLKDKQKLREQTLDHINRAITSLNNMQGSDHWTDLAVWDLNEAFKKIVLMPLAEPKVNV